MAAEQEFKTGDVVRLKSDGPSMTVLCTADSPYKAGEGSTWYRTVWFRAADHSDPHQGVFPGEALKKPSP